MPTKLPPVRSWLYAPGNNAKLIESVFSSGADAVVLDLEDAVPAAEKARARDLVAAAIRQRWQALQSTAPSGRSTPDPGPSGSQYAAHSTQQTPLLFVRVNHPETGLTEGDVNAVVQPGLDGLRLPKVEDADTVRQLSEWVSVAEQSARLPIGWLPFVCNVETAKGVHCAREIASAHPRVVALGYGGADFTRDINAIATAEGLETLYARSQLVMLSRVAGIRAPVDTVYRHVQDDAGLEAAARQARVLGFFGKSTIHPRQVPIVNAVFTPTGEEIAWARSVVEASIVAEATDSASLKLASGEFVDVAVLRRAEDLLKLAEAIGATE